MAIRAWVIGRWQTTVAADGPNCAPAFAAPFYEDLAFTPNANLPPGINVGAWRVDNLADKAALDALDATAGVIVLAAIDQDTGAKVTGYLRPQDTPTGPQLGAARTRLQNAGIPTGWLTANITVGMTLAQVADVLRAYAHDLTK